ncbi:MAG: hypothetical protein HY815_16015 [Candidatus Riflebacteria bacterium]|nr:hypothetical protein [Candidatus Riflebacteria bacterium]
MSPARPLVVFGLLASVVMNQAMGAVTVTLSPDKERLGVTAKGATLGEVVDEIRKVTGLTVTGNVDRSQAINVRFHALPFEKALARVFGVKGFTVKYAGPKGEATEIALFSTSAQAVPAAASASDAAAPPDPKVGVDSPETLDAGPPPSVLPPQPPAYRKDPVGVPGLSETIVKLKERESTTKPEELSRQIDELQQRDPPWRDPAAKPHPEVEKAMAEQKQQQEKAAETQKLAKEYEAQLSKLLPTIQNLPPEAQAARIAELKEKVLGGK